MNYVKLRMLADEFIKELKDQNEKAENEEQMDDIVDIVTDVLDAIPITLVQKDYYTRSFIRGFLSDENQNNTNMVDKLMNLSWENDLVMLFDDEFESRIDDCVEKVEGGIDGI